VTDSIEPIAVGDDARPEASSKNSDSSRMGKAAEHLVAATCIIASRARLNVSMALVDDEGIDLVFHKRDGVSTLAVQVKARFSDSVVLKGGRFSAQVRGETMRRRRDFFLLFVVVDVTRGVLDTCWLVPSEEFARRARRDSFGRLLFVASPKSTSNDQWSPWRLTPAQLPEEILKTIDWIDGERRRGMRTLASHPPTTDAL
jgi:hypothetical protein